MLHTASGRILLTITLNIPVSHSLIFRYHLQTHEVKRCKLLFIGSSGCSSSTRYLVSFYNLHPLRAYLQKRIRRATEDVNVHKLFSPVFLMVDMRIWCLPRQPALPFSSQAIQKNCVKKNPGSYFPHREGRREDRTPSHFTIRFFRVSQESSRKGKWFARG